MTGGPIKPRLAVAFLALVLVVDQHATILHHALHDHRFLVSGDPHGPHVHAHVHPHGAGEHHHHHHGHYHSHSPHSHSPHSHSSEEESEEPPDPWPALRAAHPGHEHWECAFRDLVPADDPRDAEAARPVSATHRPELVRPRDSDVGGLARYRLAPKTSPPA